MEPMASETKDIIDVDRDTGYIKFKSEEAEKWYQYRRNYHRQYFKDIFYLIYRI